MKIAGIAGLLIALAAIGYLIAAYLGAADQSREAVRALVGSSKEEQISRPVDMSKGGLEHGLALALDIERQRVEETDRLSGR